MANLQSAGYLALQALAPQIFRGGELNAERMYIVGRSGSGKSFLARAFARVYSLSPNHPRAYRAGVCVFDPNGLFKLDGADIVHDPAKIAPSKKRPVVVYRPSPQYTTAEGWNEAFRVLFDSKDPVLLIIDEYTALEALFAIRKIEGGNMLTAYMSRGRSRGKGAIILTQAPANVPLIAVRNADRYIVFDLPLEEDRVRMTSVIDRYAVEQRGGKTVAVDLRDRKSLGKFEFWYAREAQAPVRLRLKG